MQNSFGSSSHDCMFRWQIFIEEYGPEAVYIKRTCNTIADVFSRLDKDTTIKNERINNILVVGCQSWKLSQYYVMAVILTDLPFRKVNIQQ